VVPPDLRPEPSDGTRLDCEKGEEGPEEHMRVAAAVLVCGLVACSSGNSSSGAPGGDGGPVGTDGGTASADAGADPVVQDAQAMIEEGRQTFRHETFGDEDFWGGIIKLHQAIEGSAHGGVGNGVSPATALSVGLKVDVDVLPQSVKDGIANQTVNLNDPATTLALLDLDAVVGVKGTSNGQGGLQTVGITCALCHSTVDDSFAAGIGHRRDGWPNRDLNVGAIVNLSPDLSAVAKLLGVSEAAVRTVLQSWGVGKFDAEIFMDGKTMNSTGGSAAVLIPAAYGLAGVNLHTYTGWGSVTYWNAFVANLEMHGKGTFFDPRLKDSTQFPVSARAGFDNVRPAQDDLVSLKLPALHFYQLALLAPKPPAGSFDAAAAGRGQTVFNGPGKCSVCHVPPTFTEPGWNMHSASELGIDSFQADRAPDKKYRTTPLRGLWAHAKGGFYHDGRYATLPDVVNHYDTAMTLGLTADQKNDLVEYLKSL
jgi:cytochrome c5